VEKITPEIHPSAIIHPDAQIGKNVYIGPNTVIENCTIGDDTIIDANAVSYTHLTLPTKRIV